MHLIKYVDIRKILSKHSHSSFGRKKKTAFNNNGSLSTNCQNKKISHLIQVKLERKTFIMSCQQEFFFLYISRLRYLALENRIDINDE
jgi:hypothetical protein